MLLTSRQTGTPTSHRPRLAQLTSPRRAPGAPTRHVVVRSERDEGFVSGFVVGGVLFGALGFLFAPQISKALIGEDQRLRMPRFTADEVKDPAATKQELIDKIASLNASIDEVAASLKTKDPAVASEAKNLTADLKKMFQLN